jgi:hypothetical protein
MEKALLNPNNFHPVLGNFQHSGNLHHSWVLGKEVGGGGRGCLSLFISSPPGNANAPKEINEIIKGT